MQSSTEHVRQSAVPTVFFLEQNPCHKTKTEKKIHKLKKKFL